ncbi:MAG: hypothetical protein V3U74_01405, partial [Thermodesulfobacteriota bacterium]
MEAETSEGLMVELPEVFECSVEEDTLTEEQILEWIDIRINDWIEDNIENFEALGLTVDDVHEILNSITIVVHDDYAFPCGSGNPTSFCGDFIEITEEGDVRLHTSIYLDKHHRFPRPERLFDVVCVRSTDDIHRLTNNLVWSRKNCFYWGSIPLNEEGERIGFPTFTKELDRLILGVEQIRRVIEPFDCSLLPLIVDGDGVVPPCETDADCEAGEVCEAGECVECREDEDCAVDEVCSVAGECVPNCETDADCEVGEVCDDGECVPECETDVDCAGSEVCEAGECVPECVTDVDCAGSEVCEAGECVPECVTDVDCT